jgi:hypothetical protein
MVLDRAKRGVVLDFNHCATFEGETLNRPHPKKTSIAGQRNCSAPRRWLPHLNLQPAGGISLANAVSRYQAMGKAAAMFASPLSAFMALDRESRRALNPAFDHPLADER